MFVGHLKDIPLTEMKVPGACGAFKQVIIGPEQGWEGYVMRVMTLAKEGNSPQHSHDWPHINYVIAGEGVIVMDGKEYAIEAGSCAYVPNNIEHCFKNTGDQGLKFMCIVPEIGEF